MAVRGGRANWFKVGYTRDMRITILLGFGIAILAVLSGLAIEISSSDPVLLATNYNVLTSLSGALFGAAVVGLFMMFWGFRMEKHINALVREEQTHHPQDKPKAPRHTHWWHGV